MRRENQNRDAYLSTLPYATDQGVRNKASRITLPAMLADTTDAKRRWAEANGSEQRFGVCRNTRWQLCRIRYGWEKPVIFNMSCNEEGNQDT